ASEAAKEIGAGGREEVVVGELAVGFDLVDELEPYLGAEGHGDGDRPVEVDDRGGDELAEPVVEDDDLGPVGFVCPLGGGWGGGGWRRALGTAPGRPRAY